MIGTLLGTVFGFLSPLAKTVMQFFQSKRDYKHELAIMQLQMEAQAKMHTQRVEELKIDASIRETEALLRHDVAATEKASPWVHSLRASVRPVITYAFMAIFALVEITSLVMLMDLGENFLSALSLVWNEPEQAMFGAILGFWFGSRTFSDKKD